MADQKLTDRAEITNPSNEMYVHVVDATDFSEDPEGTSKKMLRSNFLGAIFTQLFTALSDTPNTYTGQGSKLVIVNPSEAGLQFTENVFIGQQDTPPDYTGDDGKVVTVKTGGGLEFLFQTFLNLQDVSETTFEFQEGKAVTVDLSEGDPGVYSLKFTDLPTYEDIYGGNAIIKGGLIKRPGENLDFTIWGEKYIINGQFLQIPISGDVTNSPGDAFFDRQDVYFIETDNANPPNITVGILEGTPSANPTIPTLDLSTQVQVSVTLVKANATIDPNSSIDTIYDENSGLPTEWTNTKIPTGADMAYAIDPAVGTFSILLAAIGGSDTMRFLNDSDITYVGEEKLVFYIKTVLTFTAKSRIGFKLLNSSTGDYWILTVSPTTLRNYGYNPSSVDWQLIQINLSDFTASNKFATLYDTLEIIFTATPVFSLDWIVLQGGVPNPSERTQSFNQHTDTNFPTPQNRDKIQYDGVTDTFINRYDLGGLNYYNLDYEFVAPLPIGTFPLGVVAFDNVDPALTNTVTFSFTNLAGQNAEQFLKQIQVGDAFTFFSFDNLANAEVFTVTATPTISATTAIIGVSYNAGDSTGTGLIVGERLDVQWLLNRSEFKQYTALNKPNPTYKEGLTFYDYSKKALSYYNDEPDTTINIGQELVTKVYNNSGTIITNGTVVRLDGGVNFGIPFIVRSQADTTSNANSLGIATHNIGIGETGYVTVWGTIGGVDTSAWNEGDVLYISATVAGELTNIEQPILKPVALVLVAAVNGSIIVAQKNVINVTALGQALGSLRTQTLTTTPQALTAFDAAIFEKNVVVTQTGATNLTASMSPVSIGASGFYRVGFTLALTSASNALYTFEVYINGSPTGVLALVDLRNNNVDAGSASINALTQTIISDTDNIEIYGYADGGTNAVTYTSATLNVERIGNA